MKNKGFTLIELLAVITIMGILLLVAIPAVSRTIENSRRDTFADLAHEYVNAVRNAVLADNIDCGDVKASAAGEGTYYYTIKSAEGENNTTKDLLESGGKSPFGNSDVTGYVKWVRTGSEAGKEKTVYTIYLRDNTKHGFSEEVNEKGITRSNIKSNLSGETASKPAGDDSVECKMN